MQGLTKPLDPARVNVLFVPDDGSPALPVLVGGEPENVDEARAKEILSEGKFEIKIQLGMFTLAREEAFWAKLRWLGIHVGVMEHRPIFGENEYVMYSGRQKVISYQP